MNDMLFQVGEKIRIVNYKVTGCAKTPSGNIYTVQPDDTAIGAEGIVIREERLQREDMR